MNVEQVFAYWRFPMWMWALFIGTFVGYLGVVITRALND